MFIIKNKSIFLLTYLFTLSIIFVTIFQYLLIDDLSYSNFAV